MVNERKMNVKKKLQYCMPLLLAGLALCMSGCSYRLDYTEEEKEVIVDYEYGYDNGADVELIGEEIFDGFLTLEGRSRIKDDITGETHTAIIYIPKLKITSAFNLTLGQNAQPVVRQFKGTALSIGGRKSSKALEIYYLDEDIDRDTILAVCFDSKQEQESIEMFSKRRLGEYFESYLQCEEKWETIEIMVYWDRKSEFAYEITTGMQIPLLIMNEHSYPSDVKKQNKKVNYYNYSKVSKYGYFGKINYCGEKKKTEESELESSRETLQQLKIYIEENKMETNEGILAFQSRLQTVIQNSQNYISESLKNMVNVLTQETKEQSAESELCEKKPLVATRFNVPVACC